MVSRWDNWETAVSEGWAGAGGAARLCREARAAALKAAGCAMCSWGATGPNETRRPSLYRVRAIQCLLPTNTG